MSTKKENENKNRTEIDTYYKKFSNWLGPDEEVQVDAKRAFIGGLLAAVTPLVGPGP